MKKIEQFLKQNENKFKHFVKFYIYRLSKMRKTGFVYITCGGDKGKEFRKELKAVLNEAGFTNVLTIDTVSELNPVESDLVKANGILSNLCRYADGICIELAYEAFEE